jgi:hypothetical protein
MVAQRRLAVPFRSLLATLVGAALLFSSGCVGGDNPSRYAGTIDMPKREASRVTAKDFAKDKPRGKVDSQ